MPHATIQNFPHFPLIVMWQSPILIQFMCCNVFPYMDWWLQFNQAWCYTFPSVFKIFAIMKRLPTFFFSLFFLSFPFLAQGDLVAFPIAVINIWQKKLREERVYFLHGGGKVMVAGAGLTVPIIKKQTAMNVCSWLLSSFWFSPGSQLTGTAPSTFRWVFLPYFNLL